MQRSSILSCLVGGLLAVSPIALMAEPTSQDEAILVTNVAETGAHHAFMVPMGWEPADGLVIWNHGFDLGPIGPVTDLGPLVDIQLAEGYAVAASSYSQTGWALFQSDDDLEGMYDDFVDQFGEPTHTIVTGASLGGAVTVRAIETAEIGNVVGAMPICGAVAGSPQWNAAFDLRLIYNYVCDDVPGGAIAGGARNQTPLGP